MGRRHVTNAKHVATSCARQRRVNPHFGAQESWPKCPRLSMVLVHVCSRVRSGSWLQTWKDPPSFSKVLPKILFLSQHNSIRRNLIFNHLFQILKSLLMSIESIQDSLSGSSGSDSLPACEGEDFRTLALGFALSLLCSKHGLAKHSSWSMIVRVFDLHNSHALLSPNLHLTPPLQWHLQRPFFAN